MRAAAEPAVAPEEEYGVACRTAILGLLAAMPLAVWSQPAGPPTAAEAARKPVAPAGGDRTGNPDLLLGDGPKGRLAIYRNVGTRTEPRLSAPQWFDDAVPTGRIPKG